jgi:hypothetical protein
MGTTDSINPLQEEVGSDVAKEYYTAVSNMLVTSVAYVGSW